MRRKIGRNSQANGEQGAVLVLATICLMVFLLGVALCVDISHFYLVGTELQNGADAAALAGATALSNSAADGWGVTEPTNRAVQTMNSYEFNNTGITIEPENVRFAVNLADFDTAAPPDSRGMSADDAAASTDPIRFVQVTLPPKEVGVFFGQIVLGTDSIDLRRLAVAGQSVAINRFCNFSPLSVVQDDVTNAPLQLSMDPSDPNYANCTSPENRARFTRGCTYVIRMAPGGGVGPGNYLALALGSDRGGADLRRRLALGVDSCYTLGTPVDTEPGISAGPVRQGLNTRFDVYQGGNVSPDEFPPDVNVIEDVSYDEYLEGVEARSGAFYEASDPDHNPTYPRRRILFPIINASEYDNGRNEVSFNRIGAFFLREKVGGGSGGEIVAEYIEDASNVGDGSFDPGGAPGDPQFTVPVLYR